MNEAAPNILWQPNEEMLNNSNMAHYNKYLRDKNIVSVNSYKELWEWSITEIENFWESIYSFFKVKDSGSFSQVLSGTMPKAKWFEGSKINYTQHIFSQSTTEYPAIIYNNEQEKNVEISWKELEQKVASLAQLFKDKGIKQGDAIVGYLPNIPQSVISFLAASSIGAIWSCCSPDFGAKSVLERFKQIKPKVFIFADGYNYNGKSFDKMDLVESIISNLEHLEFTIGIGFLDKTEQSFTKTKALKWNDTIANKKAKLSVQPMPFNHPIWVLYSSGTTGKPKAITHSHGGVLLEHLKYISLQNDVRKGEPFFWFSTTGWMMWNFSVASLLVGATLVLYEGSPTYPDITCLWKIAEDTKIAHFGTSAPYLLACEKKGAIPKNFNLKHLRSIGSTGSPLPPESFEYVYSSIKKDVWLCSMSGGTDICTAFVGGTPLLPVYQGEIQCRALGCAMEAWDEMGNPLINKVGEMVVTKPMPSMPIYFWNDKNYERYTDSYFEMYPNIWRHGDWLKITDRDSLMILGRSDATLNRHGIRIGTAEIYRVIDKVKEILDSIIVNIEMDGGKHYMPLFVKLKEGYTLNDAIKNQINKLLKETYSPRHVPDNIFAVNDLPYTISGKKLESPVKKILMGMPLGKAANMGALKNPEALNFFKEFAKNLNQ